MWLGGKEGASRRDKMVDAVMGVRKPTFKRPYNSTKLNGTSLYHSVSMMMVSLAHCQYCMFIFPSSVHASFTYSSITHSPTMTTPLKNCVCLLPKLKGKPLTYNTSLYRMYTVHVHVYCMYIVMCMCILRVCVYYMYIICVCECYCLPTIYPLPSLLSPSGVQRTCH